MVFDGACRECSGGSGDIIIQAISVSPSGRVRVNTPITITVTISTDAWLGDGFVCLYDKDKQLGIESQYFSFYIPGSQTFTFQVFMESHDMHFNLSIIEDNLIYGSQCEDSRLIFVELEPEPGIPFICDTILGCVQSIDGGFPDKASCLASGCKSGAVSCKQGEMNVMGYCIPEPMVFIGALALLYMIIKK